MPTYQPDLRLPNNFNVWGGPTSRGFTYQPMAQGSSSSGRSESGEYYTPQQQRRLDELYPQLQQLFLRNSQPQASGNAFLQLLSQAGGAPLAAQPSSFSPAYDFGQATALGPVGDYGQVGQFPTIGRGVPRPDQVVKEERNENNALAAASFAGTAKELREGMAGAGFVTAPGNALLAELDQGALMRTNMLRQQNDLNITKTAAELNAKHLLAQEQADVERSRMMGAEDFQRKAATAREGWERQQFQAQEGLQRQQLTDRGRREREQSVADDRYRWAQASDQSDLERRRIATQLSALQSQERNSNQNALLQAMMQTNRPLQRSRSQQNSESGLTGGGRLASRNSNIWNNGLWS